MGNMSNPMELTGCVSPPKSETAEDPMEPTVEKENLMNPQECLELFVIQAHSEQVGFRLDLLTEVDVTFEVSLLKIVTT